MKCRRHNMPISMVAGRWMCVVCAARLRAESLPDLIGPLVEQIVAETTAIYPM